MLLPYQIVSIFKVSPFPSLVLHPDSHFTIAGVNQAYLKATHTVEKEILGKGLSEVFGENSEEESIESIADLKQSLKKVLATKEPHQMAIQKYHIPAKGSDETETRYRIPVNTPVLNEEGEINFILYSAADLPVDQKGAEGFDKTHASPDIIEQQPVEEQKNGEVEQMLSQQELEEKQELLDKAYQLAHIGTWEFDMLNHKLHWSPVTKEVHGFGPGHEPDLEETINLFQEGINRETFARAARNAIEREEPFDVELKIISGQGDERWIRATGEPEYKDGVCTRFYGISQNVTARRQAEEDLQLSEQRFKSLVQDGSDLIAIINREGNYKYVSPTSKTVLGISAEDLIGTNAISYIHEDDKENIAELLSSLSSGQRVNISPYRFLDSKGNWRWMETTLTNMTEDPAVGGMVANSRDVTAQKLQQQQNLESLREKEILLAEIHHRVKNNLAVVSGMMQLQASEEENSEIAARLFDSIVRIKTMANIHEQLYQSNSFSKLEFADNIRSLVLNIQKTFRSETEVNIDFNCEPVQLNVNQAIPCSLIVNEVVTNVFKHAFTEREKGDIVVRLTEFDKNEHVLLSIRDNGVGFPEHPDVADSSSLGLSLIDVLSQQLNADYKYEPCDEGTIFTIQFKKDESKGIGNNFL